MTRKVTAMIVWIVFGTAVVTMYSVSRTNDQVLIAGEDSLIPPIQTHGGH